MWNFQRAPRRDRRDTPRDPEYAFFSVAEGALFRAQVRAAFAEQGLEVTLRSKVAGDSTGRHFGLTHLASLCHHDPGGTKRWPRLIRERVTALLRTVDGPSPLETLAPNQLRARLHPLVVARDLVGPRSARHRHVRDVAPGLCEVLALDLDEGVMTLTDDRLTPLGDLDGLRERALANLRALPVENHTVWRGAGSIRFDVVRCASSFTSSRVLALDGLVRDVTGAEPGPDGALVALPHRRALAFRVVESPRDSSLVGTLNALSAFTQADFAAAKDPVSPDVYWWHGGVLTRLIRHDAGRPEFTEDGAFEKLVRRLAEHGADGY
ncbi:hypothetical protein ACIPJQ_18835 [Streptomyces griseoviridis]|uniref:hypothetical protein n=1 Tax=Streptomyces griseoviridis TaxID=45398 RepID=UPI0034053900